MDDSEIVNKRKRKSGNHDMIFEVNEEDCSPPNSDDEDCKTATTQDNSILECFNSNLNTNLHSTTKPFITFDQGTQTEEIIDVGSILISRLTEENMKLKEKLQLLEKTFEDVKDESDHPCISIKFKNTTITDSHSLQLTDLIKNMFQDNCKIEQMSNCEFGVFEIDVKNLTNVESSDFSNSTNNHKKRRHRSPTPTEEECLFMEDTTPTLDAGATRLKYSNRFDTIQESNTTPKSVRQSSSECWNCGGPHSLRDCKEVYNQMKINAARKKFNISKSVSRYHLEDDQRFGHLMPGKLSEKLRRALGLRKNELPPYIYRMRNLGYPPGWLKEIVISNSELDVYTVDGTIDTYSKQVKIDSEKVVEYAGFNVPLEKGVKDEYKHHHSPPYSNRHSKNAMLDYLYKMYRVAREGEGDVVEICDMEISNEECGQQSNDVEQCVDAKREKAISPSLTDLEMKKRQLLAELDTGSTSNSPISEVHKESEVVSKDAKEQQLTETAENLEKCANDEPVEQKTAEVVLDTSQQNVSSAAEILVTPQKKVSRAEEVADTPQKEVASTEEVFDTPQKTVASAEEVSDTSQKKVVSSTFGTPILKSASPYSTLPKAENFAKNVSEVINFENLPDSTGKYDQMVNVLEKVRFVLKSQNSVKKS